MEEWRNIPGFNGKYQVNISTKEGMCRNTDYLGIGKEREKVIKQNKRETFKSPHQQLWNIFACTTIYAFWLVRKTISKYKRSHKTKPKSTTISFKNQ